MLFDKIEPLYFFLAFCIGLFFCYVSAPKPQLVVKFPSPVNAGLVIYKDKHKNCYKYQSEKATCPKDTSLIKAQPLAIETFKTQTQ